MAGAPAELFEGAHAARQRRQADKAFASQRVELPVFLLAPLPLPQLAQAQVRAEVEAELNRIETEAHAEVRARGWAVVGAQQLQRLSPFKRAKSWEPLRSLNPTFAVGRGQRKAFFAAVKVVREFRAAYRETLDAWRGEELQPGSGRGVGRGVAGRGLVEPSCVRADV